MLTITTVSLIVVLWATYFMLLNEQRKNSLHTKHLVSWMDATTKRCECTEHLVGVYRELFDAHLVQYHHSYVGCGIPYCCAMMLIYSTSNPTEGTMESCPQCHRVWRFEDGRWAKATVELPVVGVVQPSPPARSPYDYGCCATEIGKVSDDERVRGKLVECPTCKCAWSYRSPDWELVVCPANKMNEELR